MDLNHINKSEEFSINQREIFGRHSHPKYNTVVKSIYFSLENYLKLYLRLINLFFSVR